MNEVAHNDAVDLFPEGAFDQHGIFEVTVLPEKRLFTIDAFWIDDFKKGEEVVQNLSRFFVDIRFSAQLFAA